MTVRRFYPGKRSNLRSPTSLTLNGFLARVLIHIPEPQKHLVRFYGVYANRIRATYRADDSALAGAGGEANEATTRRTLSAWWAELIYRSVSCPEPIGRKFP
jgi:hypothetical protein